MQRCILRHKQVEPNFKAVFKFMTEELINSGTTVSATSPPTVLKVTELLYKLQQMARYIMGYKNNYIIEMNLTDRWEYTIPHYTAFLLLDNQHENLTDRWEYTVTIIPHYTAFLLLDNQYGNIYSYISSLHSLPPARQSI